MWAGETGEQVIILEVNVEFCRNLGDFGPPEWCWLADLSDSDYLYRQRPFAQHSAHSRRSPDYTLRSARSQGGRSVSWRKSRLGPPAVNSPNQAAATAVTVASPDSITPPTVAHHPESRVTLLTLRAGRVFPFISWDGVKRGVGGQTGRKERGS